MGIDGRPIALDICCRKGGATVGLQRAGFYVIGVDIEPQPGYPGDEFVKGDGLRVLETLANPNNELWSPVLGWFRPAFIWQSWPCQEGNTITNGTHGHRENNHPQFIPQGRELSNALGIPWVIEQPTASRAGLIRHDLVLCMDMFKGDMPPPWVQKHRSFEFGCWPGALPVQPGHPDGPVRGPSMNIGGFPKSAGHATRVRGRRHYVTYDGDYVAAYGKGGGKGDFKEIAHAMQIDWMTDRFDLCEAIPPAFSQYIGEQFLRGAR